MMAAQVDGLVAEGGGAADALWEEIRRDANDDFPLDMLKVRVSDALTNLCVRFGPFWILFFGTKSHFLIYLFFRVRIYLFIFMYLLMYAYMYLYIRALIKYLCIFIIYNPCRMLIILH